MNPAQDVPSFDDLTGRPFDRRHDLFEIRRNGNLLTGRADAAIAGSIRRWADERNLTVALEAVTAEPGVVTAQTLLRSDPSPRGVAVTEALLGQPVDILRAEGDWRLVRTRDDRYLGWIRADRVRIGSARPTHAITAVRAHAYALPRVQGEVLARLSWGARIRHLATHGDWHEVRLPDGRGAFVVAVACTAMAEIETVDPLEAWDRFLWTPYVWGGSSAWGIDCSGYVQLLHRMAGRSLPRDADQQARAGTRVDRPEAGDLAIFPGHIGIMLDEQRIAHASGTAMRVTVDVLGETPHLTDRLEGFVRIDENATPPFSLS